MSGLESQDALIVASPEVTEAVERLAAGECLVGLHVDDVGQRAAALEAVIERIADTDTKLAWICNPLRSPLTIERVFLQAVGAEADLRVERSVEDLAAMLLRAAAPLRRLLLILQQPETLDAEARDAIAGIAECLAEASPQVQFLFSGTSAFTLPRLPADPIAGLPEPAVIEKSRRRERLPLFVLALLIGLGAVVTPKLFDQAVPATPAMSEPMAQAAAPPKPTPPATVDVASLRREFDAFLAQRTPTIPALSDSQKDALFQEFLDRHRERHRSNQL